MKLKITDETIGWGIALAMAAIIGVVGIATNIKDTDKKNIEKIVIDESENTKKVFTIRGKEYSLEYNKDGNPMLVPYQLKPEAESDGYRGK